MGIKKKQQEIDVVENKRAQLISQLDPIAAVMISKRLRSRKELLLESIEALSASVALWEWTRYMLSDQSIFAGLYANYIFERIHHVPIVLVAKLLLLIPPLLLEPNSVAQLGVIAICESLFAGYMMLFAPYNNAWMIVLSHVSSVHNCGLIALQSIFIARELDADVSYPVGTTMVTFSSTFFVIIVSFSIFALVTPIALDRYRKRKRRQAYALFFGDKAAEESDSLLLLDPVDGIRPYQWVIPTKIEDDDSALKARFETQSTMELMEAASLNATAVATVKDSTVGMPFTAFGVDEGQHEHPSAATGGDVQAVMTADSSAPGRAAAAKPENVPSWMRSTKSSSTKTGADARGAKPAPKAASRRR